jgi:hypothetical protein
MSNSTQNKLKVFVILALNLVLIYRFQFLNKFSILQGDITAYDNTIQSSMEAAVKRGLAFSSLADLQRVEPFWISERGPFFWTDKLMLLYQLIRSPHETYPPSHIHG